MAREAAYCARFAPKRIAEFAAGRLCARRVLEELGIAGFALEANLDRSPRWPDGISGSITHTDGFCGVAAAHADRFAGIGVDAENIGRITPEIGPLIFTDDERVALDSLDGTVRARAKTIVFSAKEAFYKCQFAVTGAWRDFHDVSLELRPRDLNSGSQSGEFVVAPSATTRVADWGVPTPLLGRFAIEAQLVVTGIAIPADAIRRTVSTELP